MPRTATFAQSSGGLSCWIFNDFVTGHHFQQQYASRYSNGNLHRVKRAAEVCFLSDGAPSKDLDPTFGKPWMVGLPDIAGKGAVALADAYASNGKAIGQSSFDAKRHRGKMNVAFCDGHVETLNIAADDLAKVYLIPNGSRHAPRSAVRGLIRFVATPS